MEKIKQKHGKENMKVCRCFEKHLHCNAEQGRTRGVQGNPVIVYFHVHGMNEYNVPANGADTSQYEDKNEDQSLKTL